MMDRLFMTLSVVILAGCHTLTYVKEKGWLL